MLLTRDQEATLWNLQQTIVVPSGTYLYSPYYLRDLGGGEYERLSFDQLPPDAKDQLLSNRGIKMPVESNVTAREWISKQDGVVKGNDYLYRFLYNGIPCVGIIATSMWGEEVKIMPKISTDDIGAGAGCAIIKKFERN